MNEIIVLDSFALVSLFHKEPGGEKVKQILHNLSASKTSALLNLVNWGEFYYITRRRVGKSKAEEALTLLEQLPIRIVPLDEKMVKEAAEVKADFPISYSDAFCVATAQRSKGKIITNDPEFKSVQHLVPVMWLNSPSPSGDQ